MATRRVVVVVCDDCGDGETQAVGDPVKATIDGVRYEFDLCAEHKAAWRDTGRRIGKSRKTHPSRRPAKKVDPQLVREWARENGIAVNDRGRVQGEVVELYRQRAA